MPERDVLPNITDPTLIPIGQPAAAPPVVEESKGLFTTFAENRVIVLIVIIVIIAIGVFAYFVAYKGTDKEEIGGSQQGGSQQTQQKASGFHNFSGQNMNRGDVSQQYLQQQLQQQQMQQQQQFLQNMMQQPTQQPQNLQQQQNMTQQPPQQQNMMPPQQPAFQPETKQPVKSNNSNGSVSAIDLLNRSKNSMMNMHDNVKNLAMQNVVTAPNIATQRARDEITEPEGGKNVSFMENQNDNNMHETDEQNSDNDSMGNNDEKLMNNMLGFNERRNENGNEGVYARVHGHVDERIHDRTENDESDLDKRFDKAFDLQQENLAGVSPAAKAPSQIAHCEYIVQGRYCKLPVQYGNKCHKHYDK